MEGGNCSECNEYVGLGEKHECGITLEEKYRNCRSALEVLWSWADRDELVPWHVKMLVQVALED